MKISHATMHFAIPDPVVLKGRTIQGFHTIPRNEAERLYLGLVSQANSCGCGTGAIGALLSINLYLLGGLRVAAFSGGSLSTALWLGTAAAIGGGIAGKGIGLWWAHRRFEALRRELETLVKRQSMTGSCAADNINPDGESSHG